MSISTQWLKAQPSLIYRCGGSAGIMALRRLKSVTHRLPCFTLSTKVTEHLKQAAKVRGLGMERQLKTGGLQANNCRRSII
ncbi:hypothetical protein VD17_07360 [Pseudomonas fluorescens]|uniref:Uncharacterized protein n=1 Tax=Pseudomonas fluorescens TaxID=294 RepID=A0A0F4VCB8_PSEFL|nr:hypothetical protein VD17_07360 [Pseudomonas fluorescens]